MKQTRRVPRMPPDSDVGLTADDIADIVRTLEYTINILKSVDCPPGCDQINTLIEMYEWALGEFKQARDGGKPNRAKRIAELCRVLGLGPERPTCREVNDR